MGICKCGLSENYPECDGSHKVVVNNDSLRLKIIQAFKDWESTQ